MSGQSLNRYRDLAGPGIAQPTSRGVAWWGMVLLIATEAALFAALFAAYYYLRWFNEGPWPPTGEDPKILLPAFYTGALLLSSATMAAAQVAMRRGRQLLARLGLGSSLALALTFLGLQIWDYVRKVGDGAVPQRDAYDSLVYLLTGAHAVHVVVGVLIGGWVLVRALRGAYSADRHLGLTVTAMYWHFVVVLAALVFVVVVLTPYW